MLLDLDVLVYFNAVSIDFNAIKGFICINVHVYKWVNAYRKDLKALGTLMNFYIFIKVKKGGGGVGALVHVMMMYMYGNTESAFTTESLDGYLPNLLGIKYS